MAWVNTQTIDPSPSSKIQNLNSPVASTNRNSTDSIFKRRRQYAIFPLIDFPWANPRFIQPVLPNLQVVLPPSRLRVPGRNEMTRCIEADEAPYRERAATARHVLRLHPESFPVAPYDEITTRRWHWYRQCRSRRKSTWAICRPGTPDRLLLLLVAIFSLRDLLSGGDRSGKKVVFPDRVSVDGGDSHENGNWIKLPSPSFLLGHLVNDDNSLPRMVLDVQKSAKRARTFDRTSPSIRLWDR